MELNYIKWWGSTSEAVGSQEYPFIAINQGPHWTKVVVLLCSRSDRSVSKYYYLVTLNHGTVWKLFLFDNNTWCNKTNGKKKTKTKKQQQKIL